MSIDLPILNAEPAAPPPSAPDDQIAPDRLLDSHGRVIRDLRLSVTDRCNFRCVYCMDPDFRYMPKQELLDLDEYVALARCCVRLGVTKLRITGGEPTLYPQLEELIAELDALRPLGLRNIAMTTNGSLMTEAKAKRWKSLGLDRVTLSLDSLRPERTQQITRTKTTAVSTVAAIRAAHAAGLTPIKINAVVMRGVNDDELADFADFAREYEVDYRFIEWMPLDSGGAWDRSLVVPTDEIIEQIERRHELLRVDTDAKDSTSMNFTFADGAPGRIGVIAPVSRPFCGACSRLRITADGKVRPCLFSHQEWDARPLLRNGDKRPDDEKLQRFLIDSVWTKKKGHRIGDAEFVQPERTMSAIGG